MQESQSRVASQWQQVSVSSSGAFSISQRELRQCQEIAERIEV